MSQYKIDKYMQEVTNEIYKQSNEYKTLELGVALGNFQMLKSLKSFIDKKEYEDIRNAFCCLDGNIYDHFRKLVEADKYENSKTDDLLEKFEEFRKES